MSLAKPIGQSHINALAFRFGLEFLTKHSMDFRILDSKLSLVIDLDLVKSDLAKQIHAIHLNIIAMFFTIIANIQSTTLCTSHTMMNH